METTMTSIWINPDEIPLDEARPPHLWATRDGYEIPFDELHTPHLWAIRAKLKAWIKTEEDEDQRADLRRSLALVMEEIRKRTGRAPRRKARGF
jgi:hypothetical protein